MIEKDQSRNIPEDIKRTVRKKSGFGCIFCGKPLYHYEHIEDWAIVKKHEADNITLLCTEHHEKKRKKLLKREQILKKTLTPYNLIHGKSSPLQLDFEGNDFAISFGDVRFSIQPDKQSQNNFIIPLIIDDLMMISFLIEDEQLYFNLNVFNDENKLVLIKFMIKNTKEKTTDQTLITPPDFNG